MISPRACSRFAVRRVGICVNRRAMRRPQGTATEDSVFAIMALYQTEAERNA